MPWLNIMSMKNIEQQTEYLAGFMSEVRQARIEEVLAQRTRYLTVVLEDIYHAPNASAVIRSCECFGIQDLHVIENTKSYKPNADVVRGAVKWIDIHRYRKENRQSESDKEGNTVRCLSQLKNDGFKIVATTLQAEKTIAPEDLPLNSPVALCFGTEDLGVSDIVDEMSDFKLKIPMYGFTESFNISVAAALCLQILTSRLRNSQIPWKLTDEEKTAMRFDWFRKSVKNADKILQKLLS